MSSWYIFITSLNMFSHDRQFSPSISITDWSLGVPPLRPSQLLKLGLSLNGAAVEHVYCFKVYGTGEQSQLQISVFFINTHKTYHHKFTVRIKYRYSVSQSMWQQSQILGWLNVFQSLYHVKWHVGFEKWGCLQRPKMAAPHGVKSIKHVNCENLFIENPKSHQSWVSIPLMALYTPKNVNLHLWTIFVFKYIQNDVPINFSKKRNNPH